MGSLYDKHKKEQERLNELARLNGEAVAGEFDVSKDPVEIFKQHQEEASRQIVYLMQSAVSEALRYKSATYILDHVVFLTDDKTNEEEFLETLADFTSDE